MNPGINGIIVALSQLVVVSQILGSLHLLAPFYLVLFHGSVTLFLLWLDRNRTTFSKTEPDSLKLDSAMIPVLLPLCLIAGSLLTSATLAPGGTDVWTYHLAFPAEWNSWHDLRCSVQNTGDPGPPFYPHHSGLIAHFLLSCLRSDILARFHQLPMAIIGLTALFYSMLNLKIDRKTAWSTVALTALIPLVAGWINIAFADISLAAAIAVVFYSITCLRSFPSLENAFVAGLATGLAWGFKAFGAFYTLPLIIWGMVLIITCRTQRISKGLLYSAGALLTGSFWFVRNIIHTGNPVFPLQLEIGKTTLFKGLYSRAQILEHGFHRFNFMEQFTVHALWYTVGIPGLILVLGTVINLFYRSNKKCSITVSLIPLIMGIQFLFLPYRYHPRFFLAALWLCAPPTALLLDGLTHKYTHTKSWLINSILVMIAAILTPYPDSFKWIGISLTIIFILGIHFGRVHEISIAFFQKMANRYVAGIVIIVCAIICPILVDSYEEVKWERHDSELGEIARWITEMNRDRPELKIAFAGFNTPYPLFGKNLKNTVFYLSTDGDVSKSWTGDRKYVSMSAEASREKWMELVQKSGIDVIVIGTLPGQPLINEYFWLREQTEFQLAFLQNAYQCWMR